MYTYISAGISGTFLRPLSEYGVRFNEKEKKGKKKKRKIKFNKK